MIHAYVALYISDVSQGVDHTLYLLRRFLLVCMLGFRSERFPSC